MEQREWCEDFDVLVAWGTTAGTHHRCRRCGAVYRWSGFVSIKVGPCRASVARQAGRGE